MGAKKAGQRRRTSPISWTRAAIFGGLALFLTLAGLFVAYGFLSDHRLSLQEFYGSVLSFADRNLPKGSPEGSEKQETDRSSAPAPATSKASAESDAARPPESPGQEKKTPGTGTANIETAAHDNPFRGGRFVISFGYNVNDLPPEVMSRLDQLAGYMLRQSQTEIVIKGYTDAQGSKDYNRNLSTFRANVVKSYLTGKGISPNRMRVIGMGDEAPRMPNTTSEGRSANRRVEIELVIHKT
jgi:general secretion pathway protein A